MWFRWLYRNEIVFNKCPSPVNGGEPKNDYFKYLAETLEVAYLIFIWGRTYYSWTKNQENFEKQIVSLRYY